MTIHRDEAGRSKGATPVFTLEDLSVGQKVRIFNPTRGLKGTFKNAVIERCHTATYRTTGSILLSHCVSSDDLPVEDACSWTSHTSPRACIHVRYGNGVRAVHDCLAYVRPPKDPITLLGDLVRS